MEVRAEEARGDSENVGDQALRSIRAARPRPHLDDKILTAWNGLMISAFAKGAQILDEPRYADAARARGEFHPPATVGRNRGSAAAPLSRRRRGDRRVPGRLRVLRATRCSIFTKPLSSRDDLELAGELAERAIELFEDREHGGFFSTRQRRIDDLVLRLKDDYDGAEPSGNSAMALLCCAWRA